MALVVKRIGKNNYLYEQHSHRIDGKVKTNDSKFLGKYDGRLTRAEVKAEYLASQEKAIKEGNTLIEKRTTTGFQIENYAPEDKAALYYAHDDPKHTRTINKELQGTVHPRESFYKWNPAWTPGTSTELLLDNTLAHEKSEYIQSRKDESKLDYIKTHAIRKFGNKEEIPGSWIVPDVRILDSSPHKNFKSAFLLTKKLTPHERLATIIVQKKKLDTARDALKHERVRKIKIQDYPKKQGYNHSLHKFVS